MFAVAQARPLPNFSDIYTSSELDAILPEADIVVLSLPLTKESVGLIGQRQLAAMKRSGLLINVARADIVNERALYHALANEQIGGYASDVWWTDTSGPVYYPYPSTAGLHRLPNVLISPDKAADTMEARWATLSTGARNVAAFAADAPIPLVVKLRRGY